MASDEKQVKASKPADGSGPKAPEATANPANVPAPESSSKREPKPSSGKNAQKRMDEQAALAKSIIAPVDMDEHGHQFVPGFHLHCLVEVGKIATGGVDVIRKRKWEAIAHLSWFAGCAAVAVDGPDPEPFRVAKAAKEFATLKFPGGTSQERQIERMAEMLDREVKICCGSERIGETGQARFDPDNLARLIMLVIELIKQFRTV